MTFRDDLARLETRLRELVASLESAQTEPAVLERAWRSCAEHAPAVERVRSAAAAKGESKAELRARLARLVELNAIAVQTAQRAQESVSVELERVKLERARLAGVADVDARSSGARETGASCDVTS